MAGKGDDRRPAAVTEAELEERWRSTFGNTERRKGPTPTERRQARRKAKQLDLFEWQPGAE